MTSLSHLDLSVSICSLYGIAYETDLPGHWPSQWVDVVQSPPLKSSEN